MLTSVSLNPSSNDPIQVSSRFVDAHSVQYVRHDTYYVSCFSVRFYDRYKIEVCEKARDQ